MDNLNNDYQKVIKVYDWKIPVRTGDNPELKDTGIDLAVLNVYPATFSMLDEQVEMRTSSRDNITSSDYHTKGPNARIGLAGELVSRWYINGSANDRAAAYNEYRAAIKMADEYLLTDQNSDLRQRLGISIAKAKVGIADMALLDIYRGASNAEIESLYHVKDKSALLELVIRYCDEAIATHKSVPFKMKEFHALGRAIITKAKLQMVRASEKDTVGSIRKLLSEIPGVDGEGYALDVKVDDPSSSLTYGQLIESNIVVLQFYLQEIHPMMAVKDIVPIAKIGLLTNQVEAELLLMKLDLGTNSIDIIKRNIDRCDRLEKIMKGYPALYKGNKPSSDYIDVSFVDKSKIYLYHDLLMTKAQMLEIYGYNLGYNKETQKNLGNAWLEKAYSIYITLDDLAASGTCLFPDIKARAADGRETLRIVLRKGEWADNIKGYIKNYGSPDPKRGDAYLFASFPGQQYFHYQLEMKLAERLLDRASIAKKDKGEIYPTIAFSGLPGVTKDPNGTRVPDAMIAGFIANDIINNIDDVKSLDPSGIIYLKHKAYYIKAKADMAMLMDNKQMSDADKLEKAEALIKDFENVLLRIYSPNTINSGEGERANRLNALHIELMNNGQNGDITHRKFKDIDYPLYILVYSELAKMNELKACLKANQKDSQDAKFFAIAEQWRVKANALCNHPQSVSEYDIYIRPQMLDLDLAKIDLESLKVDLVARDAETIKRVLNKLDALIAKADSLSIPVDYTGEIAERSRLDIERIKLEVRCRKIFYINKQREQLLIKAGITDKKQVILKIYGELEVRAGKLLPLGPTAKSPLKEDIIYPLLNMFGVNSVILGIDKEKGVAGIRAYYKKYIKGDSVQKGIGIKLDMVDSLVNATVGGEKKDAGMKREIEEFINKALNDPKTDEPSKIRLYIWKARLNNWFYDELKAEYKNTDYLRSAEKDYAKVIEMYNKLSTSQLNDLMENNPTLLEIFEEYASVEFALVNATSKGDDMLTRLGKYQDIADFIMQKIMIVKTGTIGLTPDIIQKVSDGDSAAKKKAKQTLIYISLSFNDPDLKSIIEAVRTRKSLKLQIETLKVMKPKEEGGVVPKALIDAKLSSSTASLAKLEGAMRKLTEDKLTLLYNAEKYRDSLNSYLGKALNDEPDSNDPQVQARYLLTKAQFTGWTANGDMGKYKLSAELYQQAIDNDSSVMNAKAWIDYAEVLTILTYMGDDRRAQAIEYLEKVRKDDDGLYGAKACIHLAGLASTEAEKDQAKLEEVKKYYYEALSKLTKKPVPQTDQLKFYTDTIKAMPLSFHGVTLETKQINEKIIESICRVGLIEMRQFLILEAKERVDAYEKVRTSISSIESIVKGHKWYPPLTDTITEFLNNYDLVMRSYRDGLSSVDGTGSAKMTDFESTKEYIGSNNRTVDYTAKVDYLVEQLSIKGGK